MSELKTIAKETAQPAVKGAAIVAASGGLVASFAGTANAAEGSPAVAADAAAASTAPAVVGPQGSAVQAPSALSSIGFVAKPASKTTAVKPRVIKDVKVETARKEAKEAEQREAAEARAAAAERSQASRASRTSTRTATSTRTTTTTRTAPDPAPSASGIVGIAKSMFGVPYVYGGTTPSGFDCSGLTSYVYRQAGISIPRTASAQKAAATPVSSPRPGDLVFFGYPVYHVGIYVSPGTMIDAQRPGTTIGYHSIWTKPSGYGRF
jgi:cell wall-associated NlpC family hydrolase